MIFNYSGVFHSHQAAALRVLVYGQAYQDTVCQVPTGLLQARGQWGVWGQRGNPSPQDDGANLNLYKEASLHPAGRWVHHSSFLQRTQDNTSTPVQSQFYNQPCTLVCKSSCTCGTDNQNCGFERVSDILQPSYQRQKRENQVRQR